MTRQYRRKQKVKRFLFANGISLITLLALAYHAGIIVNKMETQHETISRIEKQIDEIDKDVTKIREKLAGYDVELRRNTR